MFMHMLVEVRVQSWGQLLLALSETFSHHTGAPGLTRLTGQQTSESTCFCSPIPGSHRCAEDLNFKSSCSLELDLPASASGEFQRDYG